MDKPNPIYYASDDTPAYTSKHKLVGVISCVVGVFSLTLSVTMIRWAFEALDGVGRDRLHRHEAYDGEYQALRDACIHAICLDSALLALALLVTSAAVLLWRCHPLGVPLHYLYAGLQLAVGLEYALVTISDLKHTPADVVSCLGVIPGVIIASYPIVVLLLLKELRPRSPTACE